MRRSTSGRLAGSRGSCSHPGMSTIEYSVMPGPPALSGRPGRRRPRRAAARARPRRRPRSTGRGVSTTRRHRGRRCAGRCRRGGRVCPPTARVTSTPHSALRTPHPVAEVVQQVLRRPTTERPCRTELQQARQVVAVRIRGPEHPEGCAHSRREVTPGVVVLTAPSGVYQDVDGADRLAGMRPWAGREPCLPAVARFRRCGRTECDRRRAPHASGREARCRQERTARLRPGADRHRVADARRRHRRRRRRRRRRRHRHETVTGSHSSPSSRAAWMRWLPSLMVHEPPSLESPTASRGWLVCPDHEPPASVRGVGASVTGRLAAVGGRAYT